MLLEKKSNYADIATGGDLWYAKSRTLFFSWLLLQNTKHSRGQEWFNIKETSISKLDQYEFQKDEILTWLDLSLALLFIWVIQHFIIQINQINNSSLELFLSQEDLKDDAKITEVFLRIKSLDVLAVKYRFFLDINRTNDILEDYYRKWLIDKLICIETSLWSHEWQINEMFKYLETEKKVYWDNPFNIEEGELDKRIDIFMCLYHFQKSNFINFEWDAIDYKFSKIQNRTYFKISIPAEINIQTTTIFRFDSEAKVLFSNEKAIRMSIFNREFLDIFFDLLRNIKYNSVDLDELIWESDLLYKDYSEVEIKKQRKKYRDARKSISDIIFKNTKIDNFLGIKSNWLYLSQPELFQE